ncbi:hypothetical protein GCM10009551_022640 [Nocardiopsis tropica]
MTESSRNFLQVETQSLAWFNSRAKDNEIQLQAPFQRNPVWQIKQKSSLIDTIILGYPIPELYLQTNVDEEGSETYIVVDGQQRIRACLEFVSNQFSLQADSVYPGSRFEDLEVPVQKKIYSYKFVVRSLPELPDTEIREIFGRLNRNNVALNRQELRQAAYWGEFISTMNSLSEKEFWVNCGIFTPNDFRRMLDVEYISELTAGLLFGPQNKKNILDSLYADFEEEFPDKEWTIETFNKTIVELQGLFTWPTKLRWSRKVDFYTLFLVLAEKLDTFPLTRESRETLSRRLEDFSRKVDSLARSGEPASIEEEHRPKIAAYTRGIRNSSDLSSRRMRISALKAFIDNTEYKRPSSTDIGTDPLAGLANYPENE